MRAQVKAAYNPRIPLIQDDPTARAVDELNEAIAVLNGGQMNFGTLVNVVATSASTVTVTHGLGRQCVGYIVVMVNSGSTANPIYANKQPTTNTQQMNLTFAGAFNGRLWVF